MTATASPPGGPRFRPLGRVTEPIHALERAEVNGGRRAFAGTDGFEVVLAETLVTRLFAFARAAAPKEWVGLLVGLRCRDAAGDHVVVLGVVPDAGAETGPTTVATTHASEFRTRILARELYPDAVILGWVHSHPRLGVRFSSTDRENQATWSETHHLGIVVDPWSREELAVYRGPASELLRRVAVSLAAIAGAETPAPLPLDEHPARATADPAVDRAIDRPAPVRRTVELLAVLVVLLTAASANTLRTLDQRMGQAERRLDVLACPTRDAPSLRSRVPAAAAEGSRADPPRGAGPGTQHPELHEVASRATSPHHPPTVAGVAASTGPSHGPNATRLARTPR